MPKIDTNPQKIEDILTRGVHEIFTKTELKEKLLSGKQLNLKLGTDVTGPTLHLGHAVIQRKLRDFQELGHKVTLIIGDFTTLIGDHSDKVDMRLETNLTEIKENEKSYKNQFFKTVIKNQTEVRHNSEWLEKLDFNDVIHLTKQFTISQMLDRETFMLRYKAQKPIGLDEFLYPLMQGYDSVALNCDVECGGTDQTFNLLAGRKLMPIFKQKPQSAVVMKLLTGSDGRPMGKSLKNFIPIFDTPNEMYGKIMSIVDDIIFEYFELITRVSMTNIKQMQEAVQSGENPMIYKKLLAKDIVEFYHSKKEALLAEQNFEKLVQNKEITQDATTNTNIIGNMTLLEFLKKAKGDFPSAAIKRIIEQGGVEINGSKTINPFEKFDFTNNIVIKFGKRDYIKIVNEKS